MNWMLFVLAVVILGVTVWYYRGPLRQGLEKWVGWARGRGEYTLIGVLLLLSSIPIVPQNLLTLAWSTMRLRWGIPLSFGAMLLRVWVCCTIAGPFITPVHLSILNTWWEGYLALQLSPVVGVAAVGLQMVGYSTATILFLAIPVAAVNTTLLVLCPNGLWRMIARPAPTPKTS